MGSCRSIYYCMSVLQLHRVYYNRMWHEAAGTLLFPLLWLLTLLLPHMFSLSLALIVSTSPLMGYYAVQKRYTEYRPSLVYTSMVQLIMRKFKIHRQEHELKFLLQRYSLG